MWEVTGRERMPNGGWGLVTKCPECEGKLVQPRYALEKNLRCKECFVASVFKGGNRTARHKVKYNHKVNQARKRNLVFDLSDEELDLIWSQNCYYCDEPPSNRMVAVRPDGKEEVFVYSGIDRINSSVGYVPDNVRPCCKVCNRAKSDLSEEEFLRWVKKIYDCSNDRTQE